MGRERAGGWVGRRLGCVEVGHHASQAAAKKWAMLQRHHDARLRQAERDRAEAERRQAAADARAARGELARARRDRLAELGLR